MFYKIYYSVNINKIYYTVNINKIFSDHPSLQPVPRPKEEIELESVTEPVTTSVPPSGKKYYI